MKRPSIWIAVLGLLTCAQLAWANSETADDKRSEVAPQAGAAQEASLPPQQPGVTPSQAEASPGAVPMPSYALPKVGKPRRRVGGGRRGPADALPALMALAPDHVGLTIEAGPTIAWYVGDDAGGDLHFQIVLIDQVSIDPLIDDRLVSPAKGGIQQVRLADYGAQLEVGQEYEWSVELVVEEQHRSRDLVATGWVERVEAPDGLDARLAAAGPGGRAAVYAEAGLWYDALSESLVLAGRAPEDPAYLAPLEALLGQAEIQIPMESAEAR